MDYELMGRELSLFIGTFTTLLAIINPFEVLPVYLKLLEGRDVGTHRRVACKSCVYALLLSLFFLIFGTLLGPMGIDAVTRIVGFFVSAMGVALIFDGVIEVLETHGFTSLH
jgi:small neutral amino acid transporter SnatA (MarC family)